MDVTNIDLKAFTEERKAEVEQPTTFHAAQGDTG